MTMDPNTGGAQGGAPPPNPDPPPNGAPPEQPRPYVRADQLPEDALKARLEQAKRVAAQEARAAAFKELGIEDPDKFRSERERTDAELKRYKADVDRLTAENAQLRQQLNELQESQVFSKQEQVVDSIASKYVRPRLVRAARIEFAVHMNELAKTDPKAVDEYTDRDVERWFKKLASDPDWAIPKTPEAPAAGAAGAPGAAPGKGQEAPKPPERRAEPVRRPAGSPPPRQGTPKPVVNGAGAEKTLKPGQKNSMTRQEVAEHMRKNGMRPY